MQRLITDSTITDRKIYEVMVDLTTTKETLAHNLNSTKVASVGIVGEYSIKVIDSNNIEVNLAPNSNSSSCFVLVWV